MDRRTVSGAALRCWAIALALGCGAAGLGLAMYDQGPSRWVAMVMLAALVIVGVGQPIRLLAVPLGLILAGLYAASVAVLGVTTVTAEAVMAAVTGFVAVAALADALGRACTREDERRLATASAVESLTPTDPLAGVLKWQHAEPLLAREIARATRLAQPLALLLVGVDDAEHLDRRFGPDGAKRILGEVGAYLLASCRSTDVVTYRGAGQFGLVLPDTSPELGSTVARRLVETLPARLPVSLAVGTASFPRDADAPSELLRVAGEAQSRRAARASPPGTPSGATTEHARAMSPSR